MMINNRVTICMICSLLLLGCQKEEGRSDSERVEPTEPADIVLSESELKKLKAEAGGIINPVYMMKGRPRSTVTGSNYQSVSNDGVTVATNELKEVFNMYLHRENTRVIEVKQSCPDEGKYLSETVANTWSGRANSIAFYQGGVHCVDFIKKWKWFGWIPLRVIVGMEMSHGVEMASLGWDDILFGLDSTDPYFGHQLPKTASYAKGIIEVETPKASSTQLSSIRKELNETDPSILLNFDPASPELLEGIRKTDFSSLLDNGISSADEHPDVRYAVQHSYILTNLDKNTVSGDLTVRIANEVSAELSTDLEEFIYSALDEFGNLIIVDTPIVNIKMDIPAYSFERKSFDGSKLSTTTDVSSLVKGDRLSFEAFGLEAKARYNPELELWQVYPYHTGSFTVFTDGDNYVEGDFYDGGVELVYYYRAENSQKYIPSSSGRIVHSNDSVIEFEK
jgi:hypothetical protein